MEHRIISFGELEVYLFEPYSGNLGKTSGKQGTLKEHQVMTVRKEKNRCQREESVGKHFSWARQITLNDGDEESPGLQPTSNARMTDEQSTPVKTLCRYLDIQ
ncbi:unnamed protein product [Clavelina lepadiformis]|uniref:Uncharacterized protein n=1 Tax=Clavelina lepadiformis TaxID=159417 RepID=A0ABP0G3Q4_CLALP